MNSAAARPKAAMIEAPMRAGWPDLNVQIVYEDLSAGLRAKQTVDGLEEQLQPSGRTRLSFWRFDLLREPTLRREAANEAMSADIVLLSAHGQHELPEDVSAWISEWLARDADEPPAFALLLDGPAADSRVANDVLLSLQQAAALAGVQVIPHFCQPQNPLPELTLESVNYRAETTTGLLAEMLIWEPHSSTRHWGINE